MRTYNNLPMTILTHPSYRALSEDARNTLIYLGINAHTTMLGCYHMPLNYLAEDVQWDSARLKQSMAELEEKGLAYYDNVHRWVWVKPFLEWNRIMNESQGKGLEDLFDAVPQEVRFYAGLVEQLKTLEKHLSEGFQDRLLDLSNSLAKANDTVSTPCQDGDKTVLTASLQRVDTVGDKQLKQSGTNHHEIVNCINLPQEEKEVGSPVVTELTLGNKDLTHTTESHSVDTVSRRCQDDGDTVLTPCRHQNQYQNQYQHQEQNQEQERERVWERENQISEIDSASVASKPRPLDARVPSLSEKEKAISDIFAHWQRSLGHPNAKLESKRRKAISAALKFGYTPEELKQAISGCAVTPHNIGDNDRGQRYDGLQLILKDADQIDRFIANYFSPPRPKTPAQRHTENSMNVLNNWITHKQHELEEEERQEQEANHAA